jgi:deoxycytidine triphosphate deaminase
MILKTDQIAARLSSTSDENRADPLVIVPSPAESELKQRGTASLDLRLGTWFTSMRQHKIGVLDARRQEKAEKQAFELHSLSRRFNVPE